MGHYIITKDHIAIVAPYNPDLIDMVKEIPGREYVSSDKRWYVPRSAQSKIEAMAQEFSLRPTYTKDGILSGEDAKRALETGVNNLELSYTTTTAKAVAQGALFFACNAEVVHALVDAGLDPNGRQGLYGDTPLHCARSAEVLKALIERGADVRAQGEFGDTPLHRAKSVEMVNALLAAGADVHARNLKGQSPLHHAAAGSDDRAADCARALLQAGAGVNARDQNGRCALHMCPWIGSNRQLLMARAGIMKVLAQFGCDLDAVDNGGRKPVLPDKFVLLVQEDRAAGRIPPVQADSRAKPATLSEAMAVSRASRDAEGTTLEAKRLQLDRGDGGGRSA